MALKISTPAWKPGEKIPRKYTCDDEDLSPPLVFDGAPSGTRVFAMVCDDPDAPVGLWVHWVIYNIPGTAAGLKEGIPTDPKLGDGSLQGTNSWDRVGYGGPCPPPGKPHRYFFKLYALDAPLSASPGLTAKLLEDAVRGHVVGKAEMIGIYGRSSKK
jgi:hypothetical protein